MVGEGRPSTSLPAPSTVKRKALFSTVVVGEGRPSTSLPAPSAVERRLSNRTSVRRLLPRTGAKCRKCGRQTHGWSAFADHDDGGVRFSNPDRIEPTAKRNEWPLGPPPRARILERLTARRRSHRRGRRRCRSYWRWR